jgi:hypothetical protein
VYVVTVLLLCLVLPVGAAVADHAWAQGALPWLALLGKWFVFWSGGVRLLLAGVRQIVQPRFTATDIFGLAGDEALPLVQELGIANVAAGLVAALSLAVPSFLVPMAIVGAIFYGGAGIRHLRDTRHGFKQTLAMATDLLVGAVLAVYILWVIVGAIT